MKISIEITGDITPENLEAKVLKYARQFVEREIRSMTSAEAEATFGTPSPSNYIYPEAEVYGLRYALLRQAVHPAQSSGKDSVSI